MPYEPLHHKYRPQTFAELVGQEAIATTLTNALRQRRIAPAYLFTGARGTGKTSSARILAKSLNCLQSDVPTAEPCGKCDVCRAIANGSALDVIEIDAASNTGVDNIRELIERSQFSPVQCRHKVYVIDECLTGDSLVQTSEGLIRIDNPEIQGKQVLSYNDQTGAWEFKKVLRWFDQGVRPTYLIKTTNREIRCTGNHLIRTDQGWKPAAELQPGMKILSPNPGKDYRPNGQSWSPSDLNAPVAVAKGCKSPRSLTKPALNTSNATGSQWNTSLEQVESAHLVGAEAVYDIEVEDNHNFVANGLLVHNCHMLSTAAFNALLKTLEEPPDRVVFVLATTDPQRVLPTIISRCQRFDFRRIPLEAMVQHLSAIAQKEAINIDLNAVQLVAQIAQGGLRDAESLLDQLSLLDGQITVERVWDLVGAVPERDLMALLEAIATNDPSKVLDGARHLMNRGREPLIVLQNLASFYRDLLIAKTAPNRGDLVAITPPTWARLCTFAQQLPVALIVEGQKYLRTAEAQLKNTTQPRLWLEVTLLGLLPSELGVSQPAIHRATPSVALPSVQVAVPTAPPTPSTPAPITPTASTPAIASGLAGKLQQVFSHAVSQKQLSISAADLGVLAEAIAQVLTQDSTFRQELVAALATASSSSEPALHPAPARESVEVTITHASVAPPPATQAPVPLEVPEPASPQPDSQAEPSVEFEFVEAAVSIEEPVAINGNSEQPAPPIEPAPAPAQNLDELWRHILGQIEPRSTQALLGQQCRLVSFQGKQACISVKAQPLFKMAQARLPNVEAAFEQVVGSAVKVSLVVAAETPPETPLGETPQAIATPPEASRPEPPIPSSNPPPVVRQQPSQPTPSTSHPAPANTSAPPTSPAPRPTQPSEPVGVEPAPQAMSWRDEDEVDRAAKRLAEFFSGKVVDLEGNYSSDTDEVTAAMATGTLEEVDAETDEVPF